MIHQNGRKKLQIKENKNTTKGIAHGLGKHEI